MPFLIGRKIEMTQVFRDNGDIVPVTLVKVEPNVVVNVAALASDDYQVQLGTDATTKPLPRAQAGHLKDLPSVQTLRSFRTGKTDLKRADTVSVTAFVPGMKVSVTGLSKGRGFAGVMKRHHFAGSPASHGHKDQNRMPGSIASQRQGPVTPGQRMAGRMGNEQVTVRNLEVVKIDESAQILAIKGALPGARGTLLLVRSSDQTNIWQS